MKKLIPGMLPLSGLLAAGGLVACHSFSTVRDPSVNGVGRVSIDSNRVSGLVYYLPKGRIRITGDFKSGSGDGGGAAPKSGSSMGAKLLAGAPSGPSGGESPEQKNFVVTIAADIEADPTARYYLKPVRNYFYDDDIKLSVNAKHLLSTGNATAEDQTAQIISTAASIAAAAFGVPPTGAQPTPPPLAEKAAPTPPLPKTVNGLLLLIQDAINKRKAALDTSLPSAALFKLPEALPPLPEGEAFRNVLLRENFVSLAMIMKLLKLYPPEGRVTLSETDDFWTQLVGALNGQIPPEKWVSPRPFSVVFDPECTKPNLRAYGFIVSVQEESQPEIKLLKEVWEGKNKDVAHGIAFRAVKPYRLEIKSVNNTWFYIRESRLVLLPDTAPDHTLVLDYSRLAFVKKTTNVGFVDGVPQNLAQKAPSSVLGFLAIPKGIIQAIVPVPPAITGPPSGLQGAGVSGTTGSPPPASSSSSTP